MTNYRLANSLEVRGSSNVVWNDFFGTMSFCVFATFLLPKASPAPLPFSLNLVKSARERGCDFGMQILGLAFG